jgi:hypothetical protein
MGGKLMSTPELEHDAQEVAERLSPLIKEYTQKILALNGKLQVTQHEQFKIVDRSPAAKQLTAQEFNMWRFSFLRLQTAVNDLIRQTSQFVEHGKLKLSTKLELSLRLAELEGAMHEAQNRLSMGPWQG